MNSFFEIGQEVMPLIYPPDKREERVARYQKAIEYMSLSKIIGYSDTVVPSDYRFHLDLTRRRTSSGEEVISDESQLTEAERSYRDIYLPCDAKVSLEKMGAADLMFLGLWDDSYDASIIYEVLCIEPLPHILAEWTKYIPLVLFFPTKLYVYPVDEIELAGDLTDFFLDTHGDQTARDPDHKSRYYKQYLKTTATPKPETDISYAVDLYNAFVDDGYSLILRGGAPLGQVLAYEPLKYNLNIGVHNNIRGLNEAEKDAFFVYRQRMPFEHKSSTRGILAGHPMSALIASYNQISDREDIQALQETAKIFTQASAVDFMDFFYSEKKYGHNVMGLDADQIDFDHEPNVMFLRAKQKPEDLVRYPELAQIEPFEYLGGCTVYNPETIPLYFECPPEIEIGSIDYFEGKDPAGPLVTSSEFDIPFFVKSLTEIGQQVEIRIRYENATGAIIKRLWVHIFEPRFIEARFHEVHSGAIEVLDPYANPLFYKQDFEFTDNLQGDGTQTADILRFINLKGPGEFTNTFSRYGNIFIVNQTSANYQIAPVLGVIDAAHDQGTALNRMNDIKYIFELNAGNDYSILKINRIMADPLYIFTALPIGFSGDFMSIINCYDQQALLNVYFTWGMKHSLVLDEGLLGISPPTLIPPLWQEKKNRAVVVEAAQGKSSAEFLSLILFHEICHKIAMYYGTRLWELPYFFFDANVAHLVHPVVYHLYEGFDLSVEYESYTFDEKKFLLKEEDMAFLFNASLTYEPSRHQMFPGNIMNPFPNTPNLQGDPDDYKPIISYRLTYKQALLLNEWLREI